MRKGSAHGAYLTHLKVAKEDFLITFLQGMMPEEEGRKEGRKEGKRGHVDYVEPHVMNVGC